MVRPKSTQTRVVGNNKTLQLQPFYDANMGGTVHTNVSTVIF